MATAFITAFILFLQLRIADEFKDFDEDSRYRPYRPVPRGLISLRELAGIGAAGALVQLGLVLWLSPPLTLLLLAIWIYLALMTREFFLRAWLRERPITYLWTHMLIIPLTDFFATACDWQAAGIGPPEGLAWFIAMSFFNGVALEIGRKTRAPGDEEVGVQTYSCLWGRQHAVSVWLAALLVTGLCAVAASVRIGFVGPMASIVLLLSAAAAFIAWRFLTHPVPGSGGVLEKFSGVWTLVLYLSLGAIPLLWQLTGGAR
ncbi:MAG: UbiA family prenyltransferase [Verrucomicrobiota bacterium]|nr:UbiA family prenyltransferase [Verrucomicrobiota bacterium]